MKDATDLLDTKLHILELRSSDEGKLKNELWTDELDVLMLNIEGKFDQVGEASPISKF